MTEQESQILLIIFGGIFLGAIMSSFVVAMVVLHRQRQVQNKQKINQLQTEFEKTLLNVENEIQQETLTHIGRELHDNIGQLLSLSKLYLGSSKPEKQAEGRNLITKIITEVRGLSKTLNLDWVESMSLQDFISQQLQKIQETGFCETSLHTNGKEPSFPKDKKLVLIRVIQECLNNAIKHASPSKIEVNIPQNPGEYQIHISDNGKGFDTSVKSEGSGMYNLKKRMETIGGKFLVTSTPGKGTEIKLFLPN
ncbi:sensor histidine kinase [Algoriphagus hitonicola]|uniref:histidine kinase n=1 Tax=Algoriphagus hitonicola TaxID=435880 RepID=A0A1I2S6K9_9BACT|nr:ATP-binding protein [Algoriphagus hitonicola]SFG48535.1 Histidine kinase-, DNA gyrase B-, and HSP90-like ATPase [Algoriphagus hitonicola]